MPLHTTITGKTERNGGLSQDGPGIKRLTRPLVRDRWRLPDLLSTNVATIHLFPNRSFSPLITLPRVDTHLHASDRGGAPSDLGPQPGRSLLGCPNLHPCEQRFDLALYHAQLTLEVLALVLLGCFIHIVSKEGFKIRTVRAHPHSIENNFVIQAGRSVKRYEELAHRVGSSHFVVISCVRTFDALGECVESAVLPGTLLPQLDSQVACEVPASISIRGVGEKPSALITSFTWQLIHRILPIPAGHMDVHAYIHCTIYVCMYGAYRCGAPWMRLLSVQRAVLFSHWSISSSNAMISTCTKPTK